MKGIIQIGAKGLYVEQYGDANNPSIVYFHGGPGASCLDFRHQAENLSPHILFKVDDKKKREYLHGVSYEEYHKRRRTY